jgi:hypothetical protein
MQFQKGEVHNPRGRPQGSYRSSNVTTQAAYPKTFLPRISRMTLISVQLSDRSIICSSLCYPCHPCNQW